MKQKKPTTEEFDQWEAWTQATYRTGSTRPPKSRGGIIAFLLVLVIFLSGISTALGLMNIRLFRQLNEMAVTEPSPVVFSQGDTLDSPEGTVDYPLGFSGQEVTAFWQSYHDLPPGIYITEVSDSSLATVHGILPGDILTKLEETPIPDANTFQSLLNMYQPGEKIKITVYRSGLEHSLTLTIQECE